MNTKIYLNDRMEFLYVDQEFLKYWTFFKIKEWESFNPINDLKKKDSKYTLALALEGALELSTSLVIA